MTQLATPLVEVDKIEVEDGFNPRTHMDPEGLQRLAASLGKTDVVQPLTVRPNGDGKFVVIAGHRRLEAAKIAGIEKVPVHVRESGDALTAALVENHHREDLDPIDTARGLKALGEELGLSTHKQIAEELAVSDSWVSQHLRLLNLPDGVQAHIAEGEVPIEAERELRKVAKVSSRAAECVCQTAVRHKVKGRDFLNQFGDLLVATSEGRFSDPPTLVDPRAVPISKVIADLKQRQELGDRYRAAHSWDDSEDPQLRFGEAELDAARAAGCLIEHQVDHGEWVSTVAFITDAELAADLAVRLIERVEREAEEHAKREAEYRGSSNGGDPSQTHEQAKDTRRAKREEAKQRAADARRFNEELGASLLKRRGAATRKKHSLARAKAVARVLIADNERLAARGLRLTTPQLQDVEVKQLKSGASREKVSYADNEQCTEYLLKRVANSGSEAEVLEILADALIASLLADEDELPQSKQVRGGIRVSQEVEKLLGAEIKSGRPRRR
ncbi:MAG TPA: ParB/RepB/Spo0J family partition protein, partial [Solirubrobacterales bacterium]|nr:ParB/RepB/Spo0J family partition protein [Solirubrobacterales bacterium]